jgi:adenosylcobinamide-phosphate synthase
MLSILLALAFDLIWGDPPNRLHPVMLMGRWLTWGRRLAPNRHRFGFGAGWTLAGAVLFALPWWILTKKKISKPESTTSQFTIHNSQFTIHHPSRLSLNLATQLFIPALCLKTAFAYRNLRRAVSQVAQALAADNLSEARRLLSWHLVSRDTTQLTGAEVAGAAIESLAENLTDSVTAPLLAYALGGLPAAWAYRFINTADAMWGYRTPEFEQLGKFPARLDDALNWLPARLTGWLLVLAARLAGEDARQAARTMLDQHQRTPSLNAGWTMSAMAGALGVTLGKRGAYRLNGGQQAADGNAIRRALKVADICIGLIAASIGLILIVVSRWRRNLNH